MDHTSTAQCVNLHVAWFDFEGFKELAYLQSISRPGKVMWYHVYGFNMV
jgi:hypothetical protein